MKTLPAIAIVLSIVMIHRYISEPTFERVDFNPSGPVVNNAGKWYERSKIRGHIQHHVDAKNFDRLQNMVLEARIEKLQFDTTVSVLLDLYNGIPYAMPDYATIHGFINQWRAHDPSSDIPDIIEARAHMARAWEIRGNGYTSYVNDEQFDGFKLYLEKAWQSVMLAEQKNSKDAELCKMKTELLFVFKKNKRQAKKQFNICVESDPGYIPLYAKMRVYLQKIWFGSDWELRQFIEQSAAATQPIYGDGMYAMLVSNHTFNTRHIFAINGGPYSWDRVKAGFGDIFKKFGHTSHVLHLYGYCAMLAEDHRTFADVLQKIGTEWDEEKEQYFKKKGWYDYHLKQTRQYLNE